MNVKLVCPISKKELQYIESNQSLSVEGKKSEYFRSNGVYDFIPQILPASLAVKRNTWEHLQKNGALSYQLAPELNLFSAGGEMADSFRDFMAIKQGKVLEIGCGPLANRPEYIGTGNIDYVGVDPIIGELPKQFEFYRCIGELLPFEQATFDSVVMSSCLDHMIDYKAVLAEVARVLDPQGAFFLSIDDVEESDSNYFEIMKKGLNQVTNGFTKIGFIKTMGYLFAMLKLKIPDGAADVFHSEFPLPEEVKTQLRISGLEIVEIKEDEGMLYIKSIKIN